MIVQQNAVARKEKGDENMETDNKEETDEKYEMVTLGVQHRGKISAKEATRVLRLFWPKNIVREVRVKKRVELVDVFPDYQPLWIFVTLNRGFTFENYLDWPKYEDNWPNEFDKGLFKEEGDWC